MVRAGGFLAVQRRGATRPASMAVALAATSVLSGVRACDFDNEIDPYTEYYNLNGDWNAFTADDCKANCCNDATCTVWQFAEYPMGHQAQCMWGDSADYGDSGGIQFQGEQGRGDLSYTATWAGLGPPPPPTTVPLGAASNTDVAPPSATSFPADCDVAVHLGSDCSDHALVTTKCQTIAGL